DRVRKEFGLRLSGDEAYRLLEGVKRSGIEYAFDVIWGGPRQSQRDLDLTLDRVFALEPDQLKAHQRQLCDHLLRRMMDAGYERIDGVMFSRTKDVAEDPRGGFREASSLLVPETGHIIGVGQSAHTLYKGTFATNPYSARKYVEMVQQGKELTYTGLRAPMLIAAFRFLIGALTRERKAAALRRRKAGALTGEDLDQTFYNIRFWWHVFTGLRGWNALSKKVGYPIGNENNVRLGAAPEYVTSCELSRIDNACLHRTG